MGLVTHKELQDIKEAQPEKAPVLPPIPAPYDHHIRMHHPDTSARYPVRDFDFMLDGTKVEVKMGVALVNPVVAQKLAAMQWRKGKTICDVY